MKTILRNLNLDLVWTFRRTPCRQHCVLPKSKLKSIEFEQNSANHSPHLLPLTPQILLTSQGTKETCRLTDGSRVHGPELVPMPPVAATVEEDEGGRRAGPAPCPSHVPCSSAPAGRDKNALEALHTCAFGRARARRAPWQSEVIDDDLEPPLHPSPRGTAQPLPSFPAAPIT